MSTYTTVPLVTVLSGFLGAGKTTLLKHLLTQTEGERWALVVNDVGAINMDARLLENRSDSELIELGNGCVCCAIKDDLAETLCRLGAEKRFDRILVETTGVAEPRALAPLFTRPNFFGRCINDFAPLEALVTVIDAADFSARWARSGGQRSNALGPKELMELLLEQAECADLLIINKCDLVGEEELSRLETLLRGLNPRAELLRTEQGQAPREAILGRQRFETSATLSTARWISELNALAPQVEGRRAPVAVRAEADYTQRYGLRSFVFQARQPFSQEKFEKLLQVGLPGIVRAKGFFWLAERPDEMGFLSLTPSTLRLDWLNYWWAALIESGKTSLKDRPPMIRALWEEPLGDRRQELVLIGVNFDEPALRRELEACLIS